MFSLRIHPALHPPFIHSLFDRYTILLFVDCCSFVLLHYVFTLSITESLIRVFIHSLNDPLIPSSMYSLLQSLTHEFINSFTHSRMHSVHLLIPVFMYLRDHLLATYLMYSLLQSFTCSFVHLFTFSIFTHSSLSPSFTCSFNH